MEHKVVPLGDYRDTDPMQEAVPVDSNCLGQSLILCSGTHGEKTLLG